MTATSSSCSQGARRVRRGRWRVNPVALSSSSAQLSDKPSGVQQTGILIGGGLSAVLDVIVEGAKVV